MQGILAYDEFAEEVITRNTTPWGNAAREKWTDDDDTRTCEWLQDEGILAPQGIVGRAIQTVARENRVHPVRDYVNGLRWDGTPRLDTWLTRYLGVQDCIYARAVGSRFLTSAAARIFRPGCQADHMLILEGPQGPSKSSALRHLADPWFTDSLSRVGTKDAAMEIAGVLLIEMSELDSLTKAGNSAIKSFVTRRVDRFRPPYGRRVIERPRQCVFAGTISPVGGYLKDPTGARRFWPVECGFIDLDALIRDRDQLWAEAVVRFRDEEHWWLDTPELVALATAEQALRFPRDPWADPQVRVTSTGRRGARARGRDRTATSVPTVSGMDDEFGARNAAAPKFRRAVVPVDSITVEETFGRELDDEHVQILAEIIEHFGNRYPPVVSEDMRLLTGHPQLAAMQRLGHRMVEVTIEMTP
jgi:predicted P-loop ATPase